MTRIPPPDFHDEDRVPGIYGAQWFCDNKVELRDGLITVHGILNDEEMATVTELMAANDTRGQSTNFPEAPRLNRHERRARAAKERRRRP